LAEQAENEYKHLKKVEWMTGKIGEEFEAMVTDVGRTSLSVSLKNTVEGKVLLHLMKNDTYEYQETTYQWVGDNTGTIIRIGDWVKVKVREANTEQREVLFDIVFH